MGGQMKLKTDFRGGITEKEIKRAKEKVQIGDIVPYETRIQDKDDGFLLKVFKKAAIVVAKYPNLVQVEISGSNMLYTMTYEEIAQIIRSRKLKKPKEGKQ